MSTKLLYQQDSYLREFDAIVQHIAGNKVYLDQTAFHPRPSGGLDSDRGYLVNERGEKIFVTDVVEEGNDIAHIVDSPEKLAMGEKVHGVIDWERRYRMMRLHTAAHILSAILYNDYNALITGGYITPDVARDDFDLSQVSDWRKAFQDAVAKANEAIGKCLEVKIYWLPREEALKIPGIVKLSDRLPPDAERLRIVEIPGIDIQADGGPHVKNTCEIGTIKIVKLENRGKRKKRIYYTVEP